MEGVPTIMDHYVLTLAVTLGALRYLHDFADHWVQSDHDANHKMLPGRRGWLADLRHVATYTATLAAGLAFLALVGVPYDWRWVALGLGLNAVTHAVIDRRVPLRALAVKMGKGSWWDNGGDYPLDQSAHQVFLFLVAPIIAA
jgi:hypothetical protein